MIERKIYHDGMLVVSHYSGIVTAEELTQSATWMIRNFGTVIKPGFSQLLNAIEADTHDVTEENIHHIAHMNISFAKTRGQFTMAIVAKHPYPLELAKLHKQLSSVSGIKVEIFDNVDTAYEWLGFKQPPG